MKAAKVDIPLFAMIFCSTIPLHIIPLFPGCPGTSGHPSQLSAQCCSMDLVSSPRLQAETFLSLQLGFPAAMTWSTLLLAHLRSVVTVVESLGGDGRLGGGCRGFAALLGKQWDSCCGAVSRARPSPSSGLLQGSVSPWMWFFDALLSNEISCKVSTPCTARLYAEEFPKSVTSG